MRTVRAAAVLTAALAATAFAGSGGGNGHLVTEVRNVRGFTNVEVSGPVDAVVREGREFQVKVKVDENLQSAIHTELKGDTLQIRVDNNAHPDDDARIEITLPDLRGVAAAGSGDVTVTGSRRKDLSLASAGSGDFTYQGPAAGLRLGTSGSGDVTIELSGDVEDVEIGTKGSGDINIEGGHAHELIVATSGSGSVNAEELTARDGKLAIAGSGDIEATLEGGHASFAVAGSGSINWRGSANVDAQVRSGSGDINHQ